MGRSLTIACWLAALVAWRAPYLPTTAEVVIDHRSDSVQAVMVRSLSDRSIRVWQVAVYGCENVRVGCGIGSPDVDVPPHTTVALRVVTRDRPWQVWHYNDHASWRWTPPSDAAFYEATLPPPYARSLRVTQTALMAAGYRPTGFTYDPTRLELMNVARGLTVYAERMPIAGDSLFLRLTAEVYVGDTAGGHTSAFRDAWRPLTSSDAAAPLLRQLGESVSQAARSTGTPAPAAIAAGDVATPMDSIRWRLLGQGRFSVCRRGGRWPAGGLVLDLASDPTLCSADTRRDNAFVVSLATQYEVGVEVPTCAAYALTIPSGWRWVEWRHDADRCPVDGVDLGKDQPNVLVVQRQR